jgi:hypothetical protein
MLTTSSESSSNSGAPYPPQQSSLGYSGLATGAFSMFSGASAEQPLGAAPQLTSMLQGYAPPLLLNAAAGLIPTTEALLAARYGELRDTEDASATTTQSASVATTQSAAARLNPFGALAMVGSLTNSMILQQEQYCRLQQEHNLKMQILSFQAQARSQLMGLLKHQNEPK